MNLKNVFLLIIVIGKSILRCEREGHGSLFAYMYICLSAYKQLLMELDGEEGKCAKYFMI